MDHSVKGLEYYQSLGIDTEAARFKRYKEAGLLEHVDESFVEDVKSYWKKHYHVTVDPVLHIAFMNLTGKKELGVAFPTIVKYQMVPFFNEQRMTDAYRDKNLYDRLIPSERAVETILKRIHGLYFDGKNSQVSEDEVLTVLNSFHEDLIIKPSTTNNGKGIKKMKYRNGKLFFDEQNLSLADLEREYGADFAVQKVVMQHPIMAEPHPSSVNTLRMVTLRWNNEIRYLLTFARFGANNGVQDNAGTGGVCVGVTDEGAFLERAIDEDCNVYEAHPTTGFPFKDMEAIPNFDDFKKYVMDLHKEILHHDFVSWDIVVGEDGKPVFLEANFSGATWLYQLASQKPLFRGLTEEVLERVYSERNDSNSPRRKRRKSKRSTIAKDEELKEETKKEKFQVGFMQRTNKPTKLAKTTALMCKHYDMELVWLRPEDVNRQDGTIKGHVYRADEWVPIKTKLPQIMDIASKCFKSDTIDIMNYLRKNTLLTFDKKNTPNKKVLQDELLKDERFKQYVIPTKILEDFNTLESFLEEYSEVVLKPMNGRRGRGLHSLKKQDGKYTLRYGKEEESLSREELLEYYKEKIEGKNYLLQKYIHSKTKEGHPFDCRIHVHKNRDGKWKIAKIFVRIGIGQKVMSNIHQGGGISDIEPFLQSNFKNDWQTIKKKLIKMGNALPPKIEKLKGTPTMELGFDVAIDENGSLYLFESNNGATTEPLRAEAAMLRAEYYYYLRESRLSSTQSKGRKSKKKADTGKENKSISKLEAQVRRLKEENKALVKEKDQFKKEHEAIKHSSSWRLTIPVRKIGALLRKK